MISSRLLIALCVFALVPTSNAAAQTADRWTLRASPRIGVTGQGEVMGQASAWFTLDRLALGLRMSTAAPLIQVLGPNYELREQSALIGLANRKGHRTSIFAVGIGQTSGDGGYDSHCFLGCGPQPPTCVRAGDPSRNCVLTSQTGFAAAIDLERHSGNFGAGFGLTYVKTPQVEIAAITFGLLIGHMPARLP